MQELVEREAEAERLEAEMTEVCGILNAATGRLAGLIGEVLETETWQGFGIRSPEHWVSWKCGVSARRAGALVAMARRLGELPETRAALDAGELSEDQVAVVCPAGPRRHRRRGGRAGPPRHRDPAGRLQLRGEAGRRRYACRRQASGSRAPPGQLQLHRGWVVAPVGRAGPRRGCGVGEGADRDARRAVPGRGGRGRPGGIGGRRELG